MPPTYFAQFNFELPIDSGGFVLIALSVVSTISILVLSIWLYRFLRPPIAVSVDAKISGALNDLEAKVDKRITTVSEDVRRLNQERRVTIANLFDKIDSLRSDTDKKFEAHSLSMSKGFEDMHRALGRIEGRLE